MLKLHRWSHRLMVRTPGFHPGNPSSILGGITMIVNYVKNITREGEQKLTTITVDASRRASFCNNFLIWN